MRLSEQSVSVAVLGCGRIARNVHLPALARLDGLKVVALADSDAPSVSEAAKVFPQARRYDDWEGATGADEIDAVVVCLPPHLHSAAATAAMRAGKHVYVEKPLAVGLDDARALVETRRETGVVGAVGFNYRADPAYLAMRDMMRSEDAARLAHVRSVFSSAPSQLPDWKKQSRGGGVLLDLASHHFDLYRYALGKRAVEINAHTADRKSAQDTAVVRAVFDDGTVAESHFAFATVDEDRFELYFEGSKACFDRFRKTHTQSRSATFRYGRAAALGEGLAAIGGSLSRVIRQPGEPAFAASLAAFIAAVRGCGGPLADFEDGFTSLALVDAARRSAACGQSVRVEYPIK